MSEIDGHTQLFGLFAHPAAHSKSPMMHNLSFEKRGINARYLAFDVTQETLPAAIEGLRALHMGGVNLSMPLKEAVIPLLDHMDPAAKLVGAVNTIVNRDGELTGYTTDGAGILASLPADLDLKKTRALIFGAGGAAKSAAIALALAGVEHLTIVNRHVDNGSRGAQLRDLLRYETSAKVDLLSMGETTSVRCAVADAKLIINATSMGMAPNTAMCPVPDASWLKPKQIVYDMVYNPLDTKLLQVAAAAGVQQRIDGLQLLAMQGAAAFKLWTNQEMPLADVRTALNQ
ncbi:shikimate dehydrogenase [Lacticaseibacillus pabuli]|uniref:Shikimate dehydrogenase (NADP(+)) n=1 Tax=Lacticaseibacillus pabuli TaxID=3025672 RepID=A0ABY7WS38_9LACO|nr:shikimate dehydrogenase [Lacticaseibacillus sp. KACC 23028]WDF82997.1 shikimate dehydrogenase [Lacticaseibacillus sp. KACC 23028]